MPGLAGPPDRAITHIPQQFRADADGPGTSSSTSTGEDVAVDAETQPHLVEIVATLKEITARITAADSMPDAVHGLTQAIVGILPPLVQCGVMMIAQGEPATLASS